MFGQALILGYFYLYICQSEIVPDYDLPSKSEYLSGKDREEEFRKWQAEDHKEIKDSLRQDIRSQHGYQIDFKHAPLATMNHTLEVQMFFWLYKILRIDEGQRRLIIKGVLHLNWNDTAVMWDPKEYHNISNIKISPHATWIPPIEAWDVMYTHTRPPPAMLVNSNGSFSYGALVTVSTYCPVMDYGNFPYDIHNCTVQFIINNFGMGESIKFKPMAMSDRFDKVLHDSEEADWVMAHKSRYDDLSLEWNVIDMGVEPYHFESSSTGKVYISTTEYWIAFRRNAPYFGYLFVCPIFVTSLFLLVTWIFPVDSKCRYLVLWASVLALAFAYDRLYGYLPPASRTTPKIVRFYGLVIILHIFALLFTTIFSSILRHLSTTVYLPPPGWMRTVIALGARFLCYRNPVIRVGNQDKEEHIYDTPAPSDDSGFAFEQLRDERAEGDQMSLTETVKTFHNQMKVTEWSDLIRIVDNLVFVVFVVIYFFGVMILLF